MRHRCVVPQPLPLPLPFPQVFDGSISSGGDSPSLSTTDGELFGSLPLACRGRSMNWTANRSCTDCEHMQEL